MQEEDDMFDFFNKKEEQKPLPQQSSFQPVNTGEKAIVEYSASRISMEELLNVLLNSSIFLMGAEPDPNQKTFYSFYPEGETPFVAVYTDRSRVGKTFEKKQGFKYIFELKFGNLFTSLKGTFGLLINPYWEMELRIGPGLVDTIRSSMKPVNDIHEKIKTFKSVQPSDGKNYVSLFDVIAAIKRSTIGIVVHDTAGMELYYSIEKLNYDHASVEEPYCHIISYPDQEQYFTDPEFKTKIILIKGDGIFNVLEQGAGIMINTGSPLQVVITPRQILMSNMMP